MERNTSQGNLIPDEGEKLTKLNAIASLEQNISQSHLSIKIVSLLVIGAALGFTYLLYIKGLLSPLEFPVLFGALLGNYIFLQRVHKAQIKLKKMRADFNAEFENITSSK